MGDKFVIKGLGGRRMLKGSISVRGAKNAALKAFAASILFEDALVLRNVPHIEDVKRVVDILSFLGAHVERRGVSYTISPLEKAPSKLPRLLFKQLRASMVFIGPLLARFGGVSFPHPGGCVIGQRPIDIFLDGFQKMGARLVVRNDWYELQAPKGSLHGAEIFFKNQSVTATETLMMAGVLAQGKTILKHAAMEPEVQLLADFLNTCGAKIEGAGTPEITIIGGGLLSSSGRVFKTPPDRIEAGSFLILGALAAQDLEIKRCNPQHLEALIAVLRASGVKVETKKDSIRVCAYHRPTHFLSCDIKTHEYPGFPTDLQAPMTVYFTQTSGQAMIFETVFEGRFRYIDELIRMGSHIDICDPHRIIVKGPTKLSGKELESPDLRAGLAYIIAAIVAKGESVIHNVYNVDRGYEEIEKRLQGIGVDIQRLSG